MPLTVRMFPLVLAAIAGAACAQTTAPATTSPAAEVAATTSPACTVPAEVSPEVRALLKMLQDRKATLKDFTAKVDNSVEHVAGDVDGSTGTVDYVDDPATGARFSVRSMVDTQDGKPFHVHEQHFIFDGKAFTWIDFKAKKFTQRLSLPDKPFDVTSLDNPIPLPIGLNVDEVISTFAVTLQPSTDPNQVTLRLVPIKGKSEYKQFEVTVDKKLQLPMRMVVWNKDGDITTIKFIDPEVNSGKARILEATPPKEPGWTITTK